MKTLKHLNQIARENSYILENDKAFIVIDPGSDTDAIIEKIKETDKPVAAILLTHTHYDHIMGVDMLREAFNNPKVYVSKNEAPWLGQPQYNLSGLSRHSDIDDVIISPADILFEDYAEYHISDFNFKVVPTPGHSFGGVSFIFDQDEIVFSGDALFKETVGRTDLPTSNFDDLISGIKTNLFTPPNHYTVCPGHGMSTTIGHEKNFNPYFN